MPTLRMLPFAAAAIVAALWIAAPLPARAQIREGLYTVEGQNPDGSTYAGTLALQPAPGASWLVVWRVGGAQLAGLGLVQAGVLAVSFVIEGRPGIVVYEVEPNGRLRGVWTTGGGLGTEMLTPR